VFAPRKTCGISQGKNLMFANFWLIHHWSSTGQLYRWVAGTAMGFPWRVIQQTPKTVSIYYTLLQAIKSQELDVRINQ